MSKDSMDTSLVCMLRDFGQPTNSLADEGRRVLIKEFKHMRRGLRHINGYAVKAMGLKKDQVYKLYQLLGEMLHELEG